MGARQLKSVPFEAIGAIIRGKLVARLARATDKNKNSNAPRKADLVRQGLIIVLDRLEARKRKK